MRRTDFARPVVAAWRMLCWSAALAMLACQSVEPSDAVEIEAAQALKASHPNRHLRPILNCVDRQDPDHRVAVFGYVNDADSTDAVGEGEESPADDADRAPDPPDLESDRGGIATLVARATIEIPVGNDNRFVPPPSDRNQPTTFLPGRHPRVFSVPFVDERLVWVLAGHRVTASPHARSCGPTPDAGPGADAGAEAGSDAAPSPEAGSDAASEPGCEALLSVNTVGIWPGNSCAALKDGSVRCWGDTAVTVPDLFGAVSFTGGAQHACALFADGSVRCWGFNGRGELGDGTNTSRSTPELVVGLSDAVSLSAGFAHTCAVLGDGSVRCWGFNAAFQLGDGTTTNQNTPTAVSGLSGAISVSASSSSGGTFGGFHTCALINDGSAQCWGQNGSGQLGDGRTVPRSTPVAVLGLSGAVAIAAGGNHTCALLADGSARCWGANFSGSLGDGTNESHTTPVPVSGLSGAVSISAGTSHTCAVLSDGSVRCWGSNGAGQLGDGDTTPKNTPTAVTGLSDAVSLSAGGDRTCAVSRDGSVRCWGAGPRGDGSTGSSSLLPTPVLVRACPIAGECSSGATCDPSSGRCGTVPVPDGTPCSGSLVCHDINVCKGGICTTGDPVTCAPVDRCHAAGQCDPTTGICSVGDPIACDAPMLVNNGFGTIKFPAFICQVVTNSLLVTNAGVGPSGPLVVTLSGSTTFSLGRDDCTGLALAPGASCSIEVNFTSEIPTFPEANGALEIVGNPGNTSVLLLGSVRAVVPHLLFGSYGFGSVAVGDISPIAKIPVFSSFGPLLGANASIGVDLDFDLTNPNCIRDPDGSCNFWVRFRPTSVGAKSATLQGVGSFGCGTHVSSALSEGGFVTGTGIEPTSTDGGPESDAAGDAGP